MKLLKSIVIGAALAAFFTTAYAEVNQHARPPSDFTTEVVPFRLFCISDLGVMLQHLEVEYGEVVRAILNNGNGNTLYLTADSGPEGTFTLIGVNQDGKTCLFMSGGIAEFFGDRKPDRTGKTTNKQTEI